MSILIVSLYVVFRLHFFNQFYYFYILVQILLKIAIQSKYFVFLQISPISFRKQSNFLILLKTVPFFFYLQSGPIFYIFADWPNFKSKSHASSSNPRGSLPLARRHTWQPIKGTQCQNQSQIPFIKRHITQTDFFSLSWQLQIRITKAQEQMHEP